jgi:SNF2 family DNA or RNA helicase
MLDLLEVPLKKAGFGFRRLDGTMTVAARERAIADFESCCEVMALIVVG